jgi:hypothetical protein
MKENNNNFGTLIFRKSCANRQAAKPLEVIEE